MAKGLELGDPPERRTLGVSRRGASAPTAIGDMFTQQAASKKVQFNKRISQEVADGYEILSVKTRRKVPDLLSEGLELLQEKYGKV